MGVNIFYLELMFILINFYQQQKFMKKDILAEILFLRKKDKKHQKKKIGCKCIRINTSNAKNGFDLHYEVGNLEAFFDEFKGRQLKKEKSEKEKLEKKIKQKNKRTRRQNKEKKKNQTKK